MSIIICESRLIDHVSGNRSQMFIFIIRSLGTPHGKSNLDPRVGKTPEGMMKVFTLITLFDKILSIEISERS